MTVADRLKQIDEAAACKPADAVLRVLHELRQVEWECRWGCGDQCADREHIAARKRYRKRLRNLGVKLP